MGGQLVVYQPYAGSNPVVSAMSRSKRRVKRERVYCTCWLCDPSGRRKKHVEAKRRPDPEQAREIRNIPRDATGVAARLSSE